DLTFLHVFPYSEREGTPAARMPQVAPPLRKERAARLRAQGEVQMDKFLRSHIGHDRVVIVEKGDVGRTEHFAQVRLDSTLEPGQLARVHTTGMDGDCLLGRIA
ncbi:MAG: tRNA (N(6)-L-threonylcarbamoyladenosine(37)-C(2))-methylthiotransferase MtaB, partial [Alphaproteobacteria bacterium]|nr:tRNA (N(6)-L-threonylcarbamoyladenosine(37)-C(2))-methylthiotransferase MtaB [Alphaproteobacteria bacterium]